jgi:hypothetical protein
MPGSSRSTQDMFAMSSHSTSSGVDKSTHSRPSSHCSDGIALGSVSGHQDSIDARLDTACTIKIEGCAKLMFAGIETEIYEGTEFTLRQSIVSRINSSTTQERYGDPSQSPIQKHVVTAEKYSKADNTTNIGANMTSLVQRLRDRFMEFFRPSIPRNGFRVVWKCVSDFTSRPRVFD